MEKRIERVRTSVGTLHENERYEAATAQLSEETLARVEMARKDILNGRFYTHRQAKRASGLRL